MLGRQPGTSSLVSVDGCLCEFKVEDWMGEIKKGVFEDDLLFDTSIKIILFLTSLCEKTFSSTPLSEENFSSYFSIYISALNVS